ncbi:MAG: 30S ribosomal protein S21 [Patescibacteria group bacterium]|nr:30S ribosomal protein S21 [Patescibacteria group bacterium]
MINVNITRNQNENSLGALRRFTRKVQSSGIIPKMRSLRYSDRNQSPYKVKQKALKKINRRNAMAKLIKLGKAPVKTGPRR